MANVNRRKNRKPANRIKRYRKTMALILIGLALIQLAIDEIFHFSPTYAIIALIGGIVFRLAS